MADFTTQIKDMTVLQAQDYMSKSNIPLTLQGAYLSDLLATISGKGATRFNYSLPFPAVAPACVANFTPQFVHTDWVDGESVVQAGDTPTEAGFNKRFNALRADLDNIQADLVGAYACMAEMRQSLATLLDEIRAELNRINAGMREQTAPAVLGPLQIDPSALTPKKYLGDVLKDNIHYAVYEHNEGLEYRKLLDTFPVELPRAMENTRVPSLARAPGEIEEIVSNPRFNFAYDGGFTRDDVIRDFGNLQLSSGATMGEALAILPAEKHYDTPDALIADLKENSMTVMRANAATAGAVAGAGIAPVDLSSLASVQATPIAAAVADDTIANALTTIGVDTVGALVDTNVEDVQTRLAVAGVQVDSLQLKNTLRDLQHTVRLFR